MFYYLSDLETAFIFEVKENKKPVLVARWYLGVLEQFNESHTKRLIEVAEKEYREPGFDYMIGYAKDLYRKLNYIKIEEIKEFPEANQRIMRKFMMDGPEFIPFCDDDGEIPEAEFPDGTFMKGTYEFI